MGVWYAYELGRSTSNIILVSPKRFLYFIKFKRIVSWVLGKELIKGKSEVAKLLIFHSGMGRSEFNYPAAEVLPSIWWHLKSVNDGVCMVHSEMKGSACHIKLALSECVKVRLLSPAGTNPCPARRSSQCRTSLKSNGQAFHMLPLLWDSLDLELVHHYYWVTRKNVLHALFHPAF